LKKSEVKRILKQIDNYNQKIRKLVIKLEDAEQLDIVNDLRDNAFDNPADAECAIDYYIKENK
jgi:hypothetical protein